LKKTVAISIIGRSGHAKRLIDLLQQHKKVCLQSVYHPKPGSSNSDIPVTDDFSKVLQANAVVIASPTYTHAHYLDLLKFYRGYILVEKPAVSTRAEMDVLRQWPDENKSRLMVNFNFKHSRLFELFSSYIGSPDLGNVIKMDVSVSQGLAFKAEYDNDWRNDIKKSFGVLELAGVHFIHFALSLFGDFEKYHANYLWMAGPGGPPDTTDLVLKMKSGPIVHIFNSYAAPFLKKFQIIGTNGYLDYDGKEFNLHSPRDHFDGAGRFTYPPLKQSVGLDFSEMWQESLEKSVNIFIGAVEREEKFCISELDLSFSSMEPVFEGRDNFLNRSL